MDLAAAPNPFNPLTTLNIRLPSSGATQLGVFDLHGRPVSSGVYFVRLLTPGGEELSRKLVLAK